MNSLRLKCFALIFLFVLTQACSSNDSGKTISIGWVGPLTGKAAVLGKDGLKAITLAISDHNRNKEPHQPLVKLDIYDDEYNPKKTRESYSKFVKESNGKLLFLNTYSGVLQLSNQALRDQVVVINPIDNDKNLARLNRNILLIGKKTEDLAKLLTDAIATKKETHIAILYNTGDDFMPYLAHEIQATLKNLKIKATMMDYTPGTQNFSRFVEKTAQIKPSGIVLLGYTELSDYVKKLHNKGLQKQIYSANIAMMTGIETQAEGTLFFDFTSDDGNPKTATAFLKRFESEYGHRPIIEWTAMQAYDAAQILLATISTDMTSNSVIKRVLDTKKHHGVTGTISMTKDGSAKGIRPSLYQLKNGKPVKIKQIESSP